MPGVPRERQTTGRVLPNFEAVVKLAQEEAAARLNASEGATPYEAMLDLYAEGDTEAFVAKASASLKQTLPELVQADSGEAEEATSGQPDGALPG